MEHKIGFFFQGSQQQQEENEKHGESSSTINLGETNKDASAEVSVDSSEDPESFTCHQGWTFFMNWTDSPDSDCEKISLVTQCSQRVESKTDSYSKDLLFLACVAFCVITFEPIMI